MLGGGPVTSFSGLDVQQSLSIEWFSTYCQGVPVPDIISQITCLLDESGSMMGVRQETISAYNGFVAALRTEQNGKQAFISTYKFDASATNTGPRPVLRMFCLAAPVATVQEMTMADYLPTGGTPLYEAVIKAIGETDAAIKANGATRVTFLVQTDGHENQSGRDFTHAAVRGLIEARTAAGWQFIFLGADLTNAKEIGVHMGMMASNSMGYDKGQSARAFADLATGTAAYRQGGKAEIDPAD